LNNIYNNGFYWNKNKIKKICSDKYDIEILNGNSFYRFDIIQRRKKLTIKTGI